MKSSRKVILFIAASLDGYIAKPNDDLSFLAMVQMEGEDYGYSEFNQNVDTVIMGRKTFDWVMKQVPEFPHADKESFIITRTPRPDFGKTKFYSGDLNELISQLKNSPGKNIFIDGGAEIVNALLNQRLLDEIIISIIPVLLGDGVRLFKGGLPEQTLKLVSSKQYNSGLVEIHYSVKH